MRELSSAALDLLLQRTLDRAARFQRTPASGNELALRQIAVDAQQLSQELRRRGSPGLFAEIEDLRAELAQLREGRQSGVHEHNERHAIIPGRRRRADAVQ